MTHESAVDFATASRIHIAFAVIDLERSKAFYRALFSQGPSKERPHYAKFEVAEPPVNLALNEAEALTAPPNAIAHFGVQLKSTAAVKEVEKRLVAAGYDVEPEEHVTCCYAIQNKVWATDPDGNKWEVYVLLDDNGATHHSDRPATSRSLSMAGCCVSNSSGDAASSCSTPASAPR